MTLLAYLGAYALISLIVAAGIGFITRDAIQTAFYLIAWPLILPFLGFMFLVAWYIRRGARVS